MDQEVQEALDEVKHEIADAVCGKCQEDCPSCPGVQFLAEITEHLVSNLEPCIEALYELYEDPM